MKTELQIREYIAVLIEEYQKSAQKMTASHSFEEISALGDEMGQLAIKMGTLLWVLGDEAAETMPDNWLEVAEADNRQRMMQLEPKGRAARNAIF